MSKVIGIPAPRGQMQRPIAFLLHLGLILSPSLVLADASDPAAARAQLQQGYALKQAGKCDEAIPHLVEAVRLDRTPKTLLNLAECEAKVGKLASAESHFVEGRDLASATKQEPLRQLAIEGLAAVEKKMPKLVIRLAPGTPGDAIVLRDGIRLGEVSLNVPLPTDPGPHVVMVRAGGLERTYEINLAEGQTQELEVTAPQAPTAAPTLASTATATPIESVDAHPPEIARQRAIPSGSIALGVVGLAGLALGTVAGLDTISKNNEAVATCGPSSCTSQQHPDFESLRDDAIHARTLSIVAFGVGGVAITAATIMFLTSSRESGTRPGGVTPTFGRHDVGLSFRQIW